MKLFDKVKNVFKKKNTIVNNGNIVLYNLNDVFVPEYDSLSYEDKLKVSEYEKEINIKDLNSLSQYNNDIPKKGEFLSNLSVKYLEELIDVIRRDDKTEKELEKIDIDLAIKNEIIYVINEELASLLHDCYLKTISVQRYIDDFKKKNLGILEYFPFAAKIKRDSQLNSLYEIESRCKLTIKTLGLQSHAVLNTINGNNNIIDKMNVYNNLINNDHKFSLRRDIYNEKCDLFLKLYNILDLDKSRINNIKDIISKLNDNDSEKKIFRLFAYIELETEKNKDNIIKCFYDKLNFLNVEINSDNIDKVYDECNNLYGVINYYKDSINEDGKKTFYKIVFDVITFDLHKGNKYYYKFRYSNFLGCDSVSDELKNYFMDILIDKVSKIFEGKSAVTHELYSIGKLRGMTKLLINTLITNNTYYGTSNNKYGYIFYNRDILSLIVSFDSTKKFYNFFNDNVIPKEDIQLTDNDDIKWDNYIPRKTLYELYDISGNDPDKKPLFYDIYNYFFQNMDWFSDNIININLFNLPEGLLSINYDSDTIKEFIRLERNKLIKNQNEKKSKKQLTDKDLDPINWHFNSDNNYNTKIFLYKMFNVLETKGPNLSVHFPSSLRSINGKMFKTDYINVIYLNDGLVDIGSDVFKYIPKNNLHIDIPSSVANSNENSFNYSYTSLHFKDFETSPLLFKILYYDGYDYLEIIRRLLDYIADDDTYSYDDIKDMLDQMIYIDENDNSLVISGIRTTKYNYLTINRNEKKLPKELLNKYRIIQSLLIDVVENKINNQKKLQKKI